MDIQAYIQSGIIESYVLGMATEEEIAEVDDLRKQYPEIQQAIHDFGFSLEQEAMANAMPPPPEVKGKILSALIISAKEAENHYKVAAPTGNRLTPVRKFSWKIAAAASIILLAGSVALNIYLYNRYSSTSSKYQALLTERNSVLARNNIYEAKLRSWQSAAAMMADPEMVMVKLPAAKGKSAFMATVFWDKRTKDVYLMTNKLPPPAAGKQYQLWALVDGKPVDAGLLDPNIAGITKMKNIPKAQSFAITLEQQGGSPTPDLNQLFVIGNV